MDFFNECYLNGIGVGVGDPQMMTLKAVNAIRNSDVICLPRKDKEQCMAYKIARESVPEIDEKEICCFEFEMTKDRDKLDKIHQNIYDTVRGFIDDKKIVSFLTIGDPTVYSTFSYIAKRAKTDGFEVNIINGITSFCACAASLGLSLCDLDDELHIIPDVSKLKESLKLPGTKVLMKCARHIEYIKECLWKYEKEGKIEVYAVSDCGSEDEKRFYGTKDLPHEGKYMMTIIIKDRTLL